MFAVVINNDEFARFNALDYEVVGRKNVFEAQTFATLEKAYEFCETNFKTRQFKIVKLNVTTETVDIDAFRHEKFEDELAELKKKWKV